MRQDPFAWLWDAPSAHSARAAIRSDAKTVTYGELIQAVCSLGALLQQSNISKGERVAVDLPKSSAAVTALCAILASGGAYVPIDPLAPEARQKWILENSGARCLITNTAGAKKWRGTVPLLNMDLLPVPSRPLERSTAGSDDLAYVLYTSGSTGRPKGVSLSRGAAMAFIDWSRTAIGVTESDVVASVAPLHFDLSIFDLFTTLSARATLSIPPPGVLHFPKSLETYLQSENVSVWYSVPSALQPVLEYWEKQTGPCCPIRKFLFAGEPLQPKFLRRLMTLFPRASYYNLYGPTETNVITWHEFDSAPPTDAPLPIGKPCFTAPYYLVDEMGKQVKPGEKGELWISAPTSMTEYLGDPKLTAEKKFPDPFGSKHYLYRTGDLVRQDLSSGALFFHGRRDSVVKVRGYRIELGEIESVLQKQPEVNEAVVIARGDEKGETTLVAFVSGAGGTLDLSAVKRGIAVDLPIYMIPKQFIILTALPKTPTGKVDRQALTQLSVGGSKEEEKSWIPESKKTSANS